MLARPLRANPITGLEQLAAGGDLVGRILCLLLGRDEQLLGLADNMTLNLTFWFNYEELLHRDREPHVTIHQGVLQLLTMVF